MKLNYFVIYSINSWNTGC